MSRGSATAVEAAGERLPPGRHKLSREEVRASQLRRLRAAAAEALREDGYARVTTTAVARRAGVSTATLYRYHGDLWACLLDAYEAGAEALCERIEAACAAAGGEPAWMEPRGREPRGREPRGAELSRSQPAADEPVARTRAGKGSKPQPAAGEPAARVRAGMGSRSQPAAGEPAARAGIEAALALLGAEPGLAFLLSAEPPAAARDLWDARRGLIERLAAMLASTGTAPSGATERLVAAGLSTVAARARAGTTASLPNLAAALSAIVAPRGPRGREPKLPL